MIVREILEIGAENSVKMKDVDAFERYMAYLKTYYMDYAKDLPESARMYELLGLNLLRLLSQNRLVINFDFLLMHQRLCFHEYKIILFYATSKTRQVYNLFQDLWNWI